MAVQRRQSVPILNEVRPSARDGSSLMRAVLNLNQHCAALTRYLFELESRVAGGEASLVSVLSRLDNLEAYDWCLAAVRFTTGSGSGTIVGTSKNVSSITISATTFDVVFASAVPDTNYIPYGSVFGSVTGNYGYTPVLPTTGIIRGVVFDRDSGTVVDLSGAPALTVNVVVLDPGAFA